MEHNLPKKFIESNLSKNEWKVTFPKNELEVTFLKMRSMRQSSEICPLLKWKWSEMCQMKWCVSGARVELEVADRRTPLHLREENVKKSNLFML